MGFPGERLDAKQDAVVTDTFGQIPKRRLAAKHEINRLDQERLSGVRRAVDNIQASAKFDTRGRALWSKKHNMPKTEAGGCHAWAPKLRSAV